MLITALNMNNLNLQLEAEIIRSNSKISPIICSLSEINFIYKDRDKLQIGGRKKIYQANTNQKKARVSILIRQIRFKLLRKDKQVISVIKQPVTTRYKHGSQWNRKQKTTKKNERSPKDFL